MFPILKAKSDYLHVEGLSSSIFTFSKLKEYDEPTLSKLLKAAKSKDYAGLKYATITPFSINTFDENDV